MRLVQSEILDLMSDDDCHLRTTLLVCLPHTCVPLNMHPLHIKKTSIHIEQASFTYRKNKYSFTAETSRSTKYKQCASSPDYTILPVYHAHHLHLEFDNGPGCILPLLPIHPDHSPWRVTSELIVETILEYTLWGRGQTCTL